MKALTAAREQAAHAWTRYHLLLLATAPWFLTPGLVVALLIPALAVPYLLLVAGTIAAASTDHRAARTDPDAAARAARRKQLAWLGSVWRNNFTRGTGQAFGTTGLRAYLTGGSRSLATRARHVFPIFTALGLGIRGANGAVKVSLGDLATSTGTPSRALLNAWRTRCALTAWAVAWLLAAVLLTASSLT